MDHFAYLIEDQDREFFTGMRKHAIDRSLTKEASTLGEMVSSIPRAAAILKPKLSKLKKIAENIDTEIDVLRLRSAGEGDFSITKAAAEILLELELDPANSAEELDDVFSKLAGSALAADLRNVQAEFVELGLSQRDFGVWAHNFLKEAGILSGIGTRMVESGGARALRGAGSAIKGVAKGVGEAAMNPLDAGRVFRAARVGEQAAHGTAELGRLRGTVTSARKAMEGLPLGGARAAQAARMERAIGSAQKVVPARRAAMGEAAGLGTAHITPSKAGVPFPASPAVRASKPTPASAAAPASTAMTTPAAPATAPAPHLTPATAADNPAAKVVAESEKSIAKKRKKGAGGMMDSVNKFLRGEKLAPEERAHVIKAGLGAYALDRYVLHPSD